MFSIELDRKEYVLLAQPHATIHATVAHQVTVSNDYMMIRISDVI